MPIQPRLYMIPKMTKFHDLVDSDEPSSPIPPDKILCEVCREFFSPNAHDFDYHGQKVTNEGGDI